jgi:hypothetical protein
MSEENWDSVLRNTQYLNGHRMVFFNYANGTKGFKRIDKAPYTGECNYLSTLLMLLCPNHLIYCMKHSLLYLEK